VKRISIKAALGKLTAPGDIDAEVQLEGFKLMTSDGEIPKYSVQTIDARK